LFKCYWQVVLVITHVFKDLGFYGIRYTVVFIVRYCTITVRYGAVQYSTVRYGTVRYGTVRYGTVWYGMVRYGTVRQLYRTVNAQFD